MPDATRPYLVFISHSGTDAWVAKQIAREVATCGARPFLAEVDIPVGAVFGRELHRALDAADELVVLATPWALRREYVWVELGGAWLREIPIVGLLLGVTPVGLQSRSRTPIFLKERNVLKLNDIDSYLAQLRARVELRLAEGGTG